MPQNKPEWLKPEILTHPNIPKPLHGMNPRILLGKEWWDKERIAAQIRTKLHCAACGVSKYDAIKHQWLEGHEYWDIDYDTGRCEVLSIEPLCHYCHNFIHSGRLSMIMGKEKSPEEVCAILEHGFKILAENNLRCFPYTLEFAGSLGVNTFGVLPYYLPDTEVAWGDWVLVLDGKEYHSRFKDYNDWKYNYSKLENNEQS